METRAGGTAGARRRSLRSLGAVAGVVGLLLAAWIVAGNLRADAVARDYFSHAHGGATVVNVRSDGITPAMPPFWQVQIHGDVVEDGRTSPSYESSMRLWVEPITGFVIVMGAG